MHSVSLWFEFNSSCQNQTKGGNHRDTECTEIKTRPALEKIPGHLPAALRAFRPGRSVHARRLTSFRWVYFPHSPQASSLIIPRPSNFVTNFLSIFSQNLNLENRTLVFYVFCKSILQPDETATSIEPRPSGSGFIVNQAHSVRPGLCPIVPAFRRQRARVGVSDRWAQLF